MSSRGRAVPLGRDVQRYLTCGGPARLWSQLGPAGAGVPSSGGPLDTNDHARERVDPLRTVRVGALMGVAPETVLTGKFPAPPPLRPVTTAITRPRPR